MSFVANRSKPTLDFQHSVSQRYKLNLDKKVRWLFWVTWFRVRSPNFANFAWPNFLRAKNFIQKLIIFSGLTILFGGLTIFIGGLTIVIGGLNTWNYTDVKMGNDTNWVRWGGWGVKLPLTSKRRKCRGLWKKRRIYLSRLTKK